MEKINISPKIPFGNMNNESAKNRNNNKKEIIDVEVEKEYKDDFQRDINKSLNNNESEKSSGNETKKTEEFIDVDTGKEEEIEEVKEKPNPYIEKVEEINIDAKDKGVEDDSKVKVSYTKTNFMADYVKKQSKKSDKEKDPMSEDKPGDKKESKEVNNSKTPESTTFTESEFLDFAEFIMNILDMGISTGLRYYAKDTSTAAYELPADRMRKLNKMLAKILFKYQAKFSLEFLFAITFLMAYSQPASKAKEHRKKVNEGTVEPRKPGQPKKR